MFNLETTVDNIFPGFLPPKQNPIAIYDQDYAVVFKQAKILDVRISEKAHAMEHPVESGVIITDHRIILPTEIEITLSITSTDYASVYQQIRENFYASTLYTIHTKTGIYENQMITMMPHVENENVLNGVVLTLNFRQVLIVSASVSFSPKNEKDKDTQSLGTQNGTVANATQTAKATSGLYKAA